MKLLLGVTEMAKHLSVSRARVKALLVQGRMAGFKNPTTGRWQILYPPTITHGTRGPRLGSKGSSLAARNRATKG
jgi:hypothetical protein